MVPGHSYNLWNNGVGKEGISAIPAGLQIFAELGWLQVGRTVSKSCLGM